MGFYNNEDGLQRHNPNSVHWDATSQEEFQALEMQRLRKLWDCQHNKYNPATCPVCREVFCFDCNGQDKRHHGARPSWFCPLCHHDMEQPADFRLIRRRIEDRLRKGTDKEIVAVAQILGVYC